MSARDALLVITFAHICFVQIAILIYLIYRLLRKPTL
jgi:hypothetical protein